MKHDNKDSARRVPHNRNRGSDNLTLAESGGDHVYYAGAKSECPRDNASESTYGNGAKEHQLRKVLHLTMALTLLFLSATSCHEDSMYSSLPARFSYSPVVSMPVLYAACNSLGEWCTITLKNDKFYFSNLSDTNEALRTSVNNYTGFYMGLCGFIVGLPNMPEMGRDYSIVTCYDLACSNCYSDHYVTKPLELKAGGFAHCSSCDLTYNLNSEGIVSDVGNNTYGYTKFKSLYRYHVYYTGDVLSINN